MTRKRSNKQQTRRKRINLTNVLILIAIAIVIGGIAFALIQKPPSEEEQQSGKWLFALDTSTANVGSYKEYRTGYIPTLVVIDINGNIIHKEAGVHTKSELISLIEQAENGSAHSLGTAPDFTLKTFDGETFTLSEHRGKVIILDFMAVRCPPCHQQMPELHKVKLDKGDDVIILSIDVDAAYGYETEQDVRKAFGEYIKE